MAFVGVALSVGTAVGLGGTAAIIGGGALIGAGVGGAYSAITGDGNILNSMLTGGLIGGAGAYGIGALGGGGAGVQGAMAGPFFGGTTAGTGAGLKTATTSTSGLNPALKAASTGTPGATQAADFGFKAAALPTPAGAPISSTYGSLVSPTAGLSNLAPTASMTGGQKLALGLGATSLLSLMGSQNQPKLPAPGTQGMIRPYTYSSTQNQAGGEYPSPYMGPAQYDMAGNPIMDTRERDYFTQSFTAGEPYQAANGGLMAAGGPVERMSMMNTAINPQGGMYPQGMIDKTQYALPTQRPTSMEVLDAGAQRMFANGGITYDPATQRYSGLPEASGAPVGDATPLSTELIAQLTPQYQAANPNAYSYDPAKQRYGAVNPSMMQLNAFKANQDRIAAEQAAAAAAQAYQPFDGGGGANGGLMRAYAMGGNVQGYNLGGYSDGGRLLKGPGDGVSDDIPAVIGNRQPARLADGEFVIPARIVSELGNGSTDAGAKRLYAMMDKIQAGRKKTVGKGNVAKDSKARKHLPA
jgi:hypothetical protein